MVTAKIIVLVYSNVLDDSVLYLLFILFQSYKTELNSYPALSRSCNVVGNTRPRTRGCRRWGNRWGFEWGNGSNTPTPDFNPCFSYVESVNPMFDPRMVYFVATISSMRIAPNTYLLVTTRPTTINPSWRWVPQPKFPFVSQKNMCRYSRNIYREYGRSCVVTNNIAVWMASTNYKQPERTMLSKCTSVQNTLACIQQNCVIWCTFFMSQSTNIVFACFIWCYKLCTRCPTFDSLCRSGNHCQ